MVPNWLSYPKSRQNFATVVVFVLSINPYKLKMHESYNHST